ncbi:hypothetical protein P8C59_008881 [Phyllachora maydis]|uniref:Uncharacterized protein n=1 Tax=Phyllachora maydis TaxID=1825666 RepID=A0AAD9IBI1_9PEZI|nr:hypothetical protein P8C59_008881 [Phyllachora maydis]
MQLNSDSASNRPLCAACASRDVPLEALDFKEKNSPAGFDRGRAYHQAHIEASFPTAADTSCASQHPTITPRSFAWSKPAHYGSKHPQVFERPGHERFEHDKGTER